MGTEDWEFLQKPNHITKEATLTIDPLKRHRHWDWGLDP